MNLLQKTYNFIFRNDFLLFAATAMAFIIFRKPVELFLSNTVVKYILSEIDSIWYNDFILFLIIVGIVILTMRRFRNYTPSRNLSALLIITTVIYLGYRTMGAPWDFTTISIWSRAKYADILFVISICQLLLFIPKKSATRVNGTNSFFDDMPLGSEGNDELGYDSYAELLGNKILSSHFDKSFAIGINGKWGLGKTSFIDLLKRKVKSDDIIEINFNAWNSHSPKAIIKDFFETVQETIGPYHSSLSRLFLQYSNKLVTLHSNTVTQSIQTTVSAITGFESINSLYQDINSALASIDKKILVYIDDLDRLDKYEIIEVIRLIRNTANFHNTFFIVAYDRNYVINALKEHNPYKQEEFLEKIFQIEITLPYFKKDVLRYKLAEKLKSKLPNEVHAIIDKEIIGTTSYVPAYFNEWLESKRDVTRLANALVLNLSKLIWEVEFKDLLRIELLRVKYPSAYELLFRRTLDFLVTSGDASKDHYYQLRNVSNNEKDKLVNDEKGVKTFYELYLIRNHFELSIPQNEISKIIEFVDGIFGGGVLLRYHSRSHLSIVYPSKFNRYFAYNLLEGALSEIEFSKARLLSQNKFNAKITQWVSDGLEFELKNRFSEIKSFDNREDFEKIIKAIFHLANQPAKNPRFLSRNLVGYDGKDLMDKMGNYENKLVESYYPEVNGSEALKTFVKGLFLDAISPYFFEADLIRLINDQFSVTFVLNKEEFKEICIDYFRKYCEATIKLDSNVWHLFHSCKQTEWISVGGNNHKRQVVIPAESKQIFKDFILNKDLDEFLFSIIDLQPFDRKKFSISNVVIGLFGNWENFEKELSGKDEKESKFLNEFKAFLAVFASENYSQYVDFNFDVIPIKDKIRKE